MYFDFPYYRLVIVYVLTHKNTPNRGKMLFNLFFLVPLVSTVNFIFMALDYIFFPGLWRQSIKEPVFIVGHARSGTTMAHRLMSGDSERYSYFNFWEMFFPSILQRKLVSAIGWIDKTLMNCRIKRSLEAWDKKTFDPIRHMHDGGLWKAEEDLFLMRTAFVTQQWALDLPISHEMDIVHIDNLSERRRKGWMRFYRACVKRQLYINGGDKNHLAKNPVMCGWLNAVLETFPDAKIVVMMRDPAKCIPSVLKLVETTWNDKGWKKEQYADAQRAMIESSFDMYTLPAQVLATHPNTPRSIVDYREITKAPKATLEKVYRDLGVEITPAYASFLEATQEKQKRHAPGFEYSIDNYDITLEDIVKRLEPFYDEYGWARTHDSA